VRISPPFCHKFHILVIIKMNILLMRIVVVKDSRICGFSYLIFFNLIYDLVPIFFFFVSSYLFSLFTNHLDGYG